MSRDQRTTEAYERLFGPLGTSIRQPVLEPGEILRGLIFGDCFDVGELDAYRAMGDRGSLKVMVTP